MGLCDTSVEERAVQERGCKHMLAPVVTITHARTSLTARRASLSGSVVVHHFCSDPMARDRTHRLGCKRSVRDESRGARSRTVQMRGSEEDVVGIQGVQGLAAVVVDRVT